MNNEKPRLARLTAILTQLQSRRIVTAREIAERHQVSIRTVYRDIRTLEKSGVPIYTEEGKGYSIVDGYKLPPVMFTEQEASALITVERLLHANADYSLKETYQSAITKIKAVLGPTQKDKTELLNSRMQIRPPQDKANTSRYLIQLQTAITDCKVVQLDYLSLRQKRTQRKVEPFAVYHTHNHWIMVAYCQKRQDYRAFRLDCIQGLYFTGSHFSPHDITLEEYFDLCRQNWRYTPDTPLTPAPPTFAENQIFSAMQHVTHPSFHLIGITVRTSNEQARSYGDIAKLWERFVSENVMARIPNKVDGEILSLYTNFESDHTAPYDTVIGCRVSSLEDIPDGMQGFSFPETTYAHFIVKGDLTKGAVYDGWLKIWESPLKRLYTQDYEIYGIKAQDRAAAEVDIYVAIES